MKRSTSLVNVLVIHPAIPIPKYCAICTMWGITRKAEFFGQWEDQHGPDNYIGVCMNCRMGGFDYIGTIREFGECQLRLSDKPEYEIYPSRGKQMALAHSKNQLLSHIRELIHGGVAISVIYKRDIRTGKLRPMNKEDQASIVMEAMNS